MGTYKRGDIYWISYSYQGNNIGRALEQTINTLREIS
jgi:hypothetical protein